ncbi:MAG: RdgB/HAM1 family non-canonical purine NTP pyrophosphatase [Thermoguttaceae bacterium]|nr:RdgB/HAM1 family non-canonical purine NTP pyrophosphatase [Thermoguttaceae bacterium]MBP3694443.1 RdgB/HAM1 family non-canonical purine NTP pyrophosphatase [Thermoguttaceae bacterium]
MAQDTVSVSSDYPRNPNYPPLVLGSRNKKKKGELTALLAPLGFEIRDLSEYPEAIEVDETGTTFTENAHLKAAEQAKVLKMWVIGEDSGLEVEALDGRPGVYSARFAGEEHDDEKNNDRLLQELDGIPEEKRGARYVCHIALSDPDGNIRAEAENYCYGRIRTERCGTNGFGYDPLFEIVEYHKTFGELSPEIKACISHRACALREFSQKLLDLFGKTPEN